MMMQSNSPRLPSACHTPLRCGMAAGFLSVVMAISAMGQETRLQSQVLAGGGGHATGGAYTLQGTVGQPAAGPSTTAMAAVEAGFWHGDISIIVDPYGGFFDWMEALPPDQQPPPHLRGPEDIASGDGMTNLLKYALDLSPMTPAAEAAPSGLVHDGYWGIQLDRSADAAVELRIEASKDFSDWEEVPHSENVMDPDIAPNLERVMLLTNIEAADHERYFFRLRVIME